MVMVYAPDCQLCADSSQAPYRQIRQQLDFQGEFLIFHYLQQYAEGYVQYSGKQADQRFTEQFVTFDPVAGNAARSTGTRNFARGDVEIQFGFQTDHRVGGIEHDVIFCTAVLHISVFGRRHFQMHYAVFVGRPIHSLFIWELICKRQRNIAGEAEFQIDRVIGKHVIAVFVNHALVAQVFVSLERKSQSQQFFGSQQTDFDADFAYRFDIGRKVHCFAADSRQDSEYRGGADTQEESVRAQQQVQIRRKIAGAFGHVPQRQEGIESVRGNVSRKAGILRLRTAFGAFGTLCTCGALFRAAQVDTVRP